MHFHRVPYMDDMLFLKYMRVKTLDIKIVQNVCLHIDFVCGL
jgi:hypothetical protein